MDSETFSILAAAREEPNRIGLIVNGTSHSFQALAMQVALVMAHVASLSLPTGARVAVLGSNRLKTILLIYALIELGVPIVLIHPRLTPPERERHLQGSQAAHFFGEDWELPTEPATMPGKLPGAIDPEGALAIIYTSGTSGPSKGAILSRRAFFASVIASVSNVGWQADDRWLLCMPLAHVGGLALLLRCLHARRCVVMTEPAVGKNVAGFNVEQIIQQVNRDRVTLVSLVPTMLARLLDDVPAWVPPAYLRAILLGGAAATPRLLTRAAERKLPVLTTYGLTEACSQVTTERYDKLTSGINLPNSASIDRGVGMPVLGMQVRIVQEEIQLRGAALFSGYLEEGLENPPVPKISGTDLVASAPITSESESEPGWFRTGDMGYLDSLGQLHILNRRTDLIISGGENIYPLEIEQLLERCTGIDAACVFGIPDETWGQTVVAALVVNEGYQPDELLAYVSTRLAWYKHPRYVALLTEFPTNATGKVDRKQIIEIAGSKLQPIG